MPRFVPKNPKLNQSSRELAKSVQDDGHYFNRIDQYFEEEQAKDEARYVWSGYLSPSAQLTWSMCMRDLIGNARKYLKFSPGGLRMVNMGKVVHSGLAHVTGWHKYLRYAPPNFPTLNLRRKYERSKPEVPAQCDIWGWNGKIDDVIDIGGYPAIFDLKTCYTQPQNFNNFVRNKLPKEPNIIQVCVYRMLVVHLGYYDKDPSHVGLGYLNVMSNPAMSPQRWEWWEEWNDELETKTRESIIYPAAYARREALLGVDTAEIRCKNPRCKEHGVFGRLKRRDGR